MKKAIAVVLAALMALSFIACSSSKTGDLIGVWEGEYDQFSFKNDGTVDLAERGDASGTFGRGETGEYKVSGSTLTIAYDGEVELECSFKVSGNTLTLTYEGETMTFTKK